ncbi:hypothetical protein RI129_007900 [Pyrocoelia pectoralis]|uniref:Glucose-methanol-choline oxidoreductase N-terminal domain-containing protein n=1 Tax=Pyrocoelia pectoralis TaxID=417401 RepID=A0AAN7V969_9COLE
MLMNGKLIIIFLQFVVTFTEDDVSFYVKTVQEGIAKAMTYIGPIDASAYKPTNPIPRYAETFDYIIIGGGSAGAIIASRLSEDSKIKVLLLEAGGYEKTFGQIPSMTPFLQSSEFNWNYNTTPQTTSCLAMMNQECAYPRGKALGGSSSINGMIYARGNEEDYDSWWLNGNYGWKYDEVLPFFKKTEDSNINGDSAYHGTGGELNVEYHHPSSPQLNAFLEANVEIGRPLIDYNGRYQLGASKTQFSSRNGSRQSTAKAFLVPVLYRKNLRVLVDSYVTKVLIRDLIFYKFAYGAVFTHKGKVYKAYASKEVIVSAGVVGSPQLLMLSGIGPGRHLRSLGIHVYKDLPVGSNFQDHTAYHALFFSSNHTAEDRGMETYVREYLNGYGPYTVAANLQGIAFFKSKGSTNTGPTNPDFELLLQASNNTSPFVQKIHHYDNVAIDAIWRRVNPQSSFSIICMLLHPKSKGTIRLKSANPYDYPLIDTNFLSDDHEEDIDILYEAIQKALELVNTESFKKINASLLYLPLPQCISAHTYLTKDYWRCQLRQLGFHLYHGSGSCKMGNSSITSVVDPELKVHGIARLRVADASIFPTTIAGHNNAPAMMVGEKAADLIRKSWWMV